MLGVCPPLPCRIFNLGNTKPQTVTAMVRLLEKHLGRKANVQYVPVPPKGDVLATSANISRAQAQLGYNPQTGLDAGLQKFAEWFLEYYNLEEGSPLAKGLRQRQQPTDWDYKPV